MHSEYSVLMPVYEKENPYFFTAAVKSMLEQTVCTDDFVIVCDGSLTEELDRVISDMCREHPGLFKIIRLKNHEGLSAALNAGLLSCAHERVARMDSDDLSLSCRVEKQLIAMDEWNADIVSGTVREFSGSQLSVREIEDDGIPLITRSLPERPEEILSFARRRSPFNHPAVLYKKSVVLSCGGYGNYPYFEDYGLWAEMLNRKATGYNIKEPVLYMRAGDEMYRRRGGIGYVKSLVSFQKHLKDTGFIGLKDYLTVVAGHAAVGLMPNRARKFIYRRMLRKNE